MPEKGRHWLKAFFTKPSEDASGSRSGERERFIETMPYESEAFIRQMSEAPISRIRIAHVTRHECRGHGVPSEAGEGSPVEGVG